MKSKRNIIACLFSALVLFSTSSFALDVHFCGDQISSVSFEEAAGSPMEMAAEDCGMKMHTDNCCRTEQIIVKGQDELQQVATNLAPQQQVFVAAFFFTYYNNLYRDIENQVVPFRDYSPPLLVFDLQIQNDLFLI